MVSNLTELKIAMGRLRSEMKVMEAGLGMVPLPTLLLGIQLGRVEFLWSEVRSRYDRLQVLTKHEQTEVEIVASGRLQALYEDLHARVEGALDNHYLDVKAIK